MTEKIYTVGPSAMHVEAVRNMAHDVAELVVDHFSTLRNRPVFENTAPVDRPKKFSPLSWEQTLSELRRVLQQSMQVAHPRFFGHMDSGPLYIAVLADWVTSALNQNMLSWELSPVATDIENEVIEWFCNVCGYEDGEGTLVSGGTMANLTGLLLALQRATEGRYCKEGVWALRKRPVLFTSDQAHYSIAKAAASTGLGEQSVLKIPADQSFRMDVNQLEKAIRDAIAIDRIPIMVVATAGTTSTGSVDPLMNIADICRKYNIWLHVDAAHGGGALFSEKARPLLHGIEAADSITFDPHKWLMQPKGMGMIVTRHLNVLKQLFYSGAPYLTRQKEVQPESRGSMTLQGSRRFDALRLWITRKYLGDTGLAEIIDGTLRKVSDWAALLYDSGQFELAHKPDLNLLCFRYRPLNVDDDRLDELNEWIQQQLMNSGVGFVSLTTLNGSRWMRSVFINPATTIDDMTEVMKEIGRIAQQWICKNTGE
ncbi:aspartate aminotransferase family protein [Aneurinibacillus sp. Ricciae_BoGa-3]|uniref:pyridoxal phosphate-dependent decarboxylase family protein n=1 Tax=Aneurinibacillus sp. Ricciae_BoGa-3 TaxID=3022697 RepID=UPI00233FF504|nr:aspartate aminotransferase family protein [Aneurinibacillus sp. Ricciae_BoGa-3]WCK55315.1 aspartate aminotransferase family protein [Aneurinibacillus sp. Ricciae_BoGa-3]